MGIKDLFAGAKRRVPDNTTSHPTFDRLRFNSTAALERGLDGSEERFATYLFSIYHCMPDELSDTNARREELRRQYPNKSVKINERRFVLVGVPAFQIISAYFQALISCETLSDDYRAYKQEHLALVERKHTDSQSLPIPIDLTEGQLAHDERVERYARIALLNRQIIELP
jgi:hypothetical protein